MGEPLTNQAHADTERGRRGGWLGCGGSCSVRVRACGVPARQSRLWLACESGTCFARAQRAGVAFSAVSFNSLLASASRPTTGFLPAAGAFGRSIPCDMRMTGRVGLASSEERTRMSIGLTGQ